MSKFKHQYIIQHNDGKTSGPFTSQATAQEALHSHLMHGGTGRIKDEWIGNCPRCYQFIRIGAGYQQHGCGEVQHFNATV